jgi:hypothetical protein
LKAARLSVTIRPILRREARPSRRHRPPGASAPGSSDASGFPLAWPPRAPFSHPPPARPPSSQVFHHFLRSSKTPSFVLNCQREGPRHRGRTAYPCDVLAKYSTMQKATRNNRRNWQPTRNLSTDAQFAACARPKPVAIAAPSARNEATCFTVSCYSSGVEHSLGKGEAESSNLSSSTILPP